ncbi:hypothetical protein FNF29_03271 [Cafeteria roenbergensis]|uniref:Amino acid transporter transmembrane domain-containing protein n=1 Tax=Cafeteria roenbergensis TaxID=33653 RepID=A0A5A8CLX6_CAFRO|nr:hypothetical protein FNF29_03271 [Cafeteria roenbergensis]|eukprot:KAA0153454.1 hypothetical protein FNF29_03271 [Cafeteria roenbergensis]
MFGASANLTNGIVGAGIMGLPFALKEAGFLPGLVLLVLVALLTDYSLRLLARLAKAHAAESYQDLVSRAFGTPGFVLVELAQFAFAYGALVAYLLIVKDTAAVVIRDIFGQGDEWDHEAVLAVVACAVILPICFLGSMSGLGVFSATSMVGVVVMVAVVGVERFSVSVPTSISPVEQYLLPHGNWLSAIGGFAFAFVCQHQLLLVMDSMREPTKPRVAGVVRMSLVAAVVLSAAMAVFGYTLFWEHTRGDILRSFEETDVVVPPGGANPATALAVARVCLVVNMTFTFPAELMVCRHVIESAVLRVWERQHWQSSGAPVFDLEAVHRVEREFRERVSGWTSMWMHIGVTTLLFGSSLGLAMAVDDLGVVQELSGSVSAVLLAFVLPAACHLRLGTHHEDDTGVCHRSKLPSVALLVIGVIVFFAATAQTLTNIFDNTPASDDPAVG